MTAVVASGSTARPGSTSGTLTAFATRPERQRRIAVAVAVAVQDAWWDGKGTNGGRGLFFEAVGEVADVGEHGAGASATDTADIIHRVDRIC